MKRFIRTLLLLAAAAGAGFACAEGLCRLPAFREQVGRVAGRGQLVALVNRIGIYQPGDSETDARDLIISENLRAQSAGERAGDDLVQRELDLLRFQFADEKAFNVTVRSSGLDVSGLRAHLAQHHRERQWLETQIAPQLAVSDQEARAFYEAHPEEFAQPARYRARHLFLAGHSATPPHVVEANRKGIAALSARLAKGEDFAQLAMVSEDEATKTIGGDLGFFSADRVPEEFITEIMKLRVGQISAPFQSHLGFHIVQVTDARPATQLAFEVVRAEIVARLANRKRAEAITATAERLTAAEFVHPTH